MLAFDRQPYLRRNRSAIADDLPEGKRILDRETKIRETPFFLRRVKFNCQAFELALEGLASDVYRFQLDERADLVLLFGESFNGLRKRHRYGEDVFLQQLFKGIQNPSVDDLWSCRRGQPAGEHQPC